MPLTAKGRHILSSMRKSYGSEKKAKSVFYASINAKKITGAEKGRAEGGRVKSMAQAVSPQDEQQSIMSAASAMGEQSPVIQAMQRGHLSRMRSQQLQQRAHGGHVDGHEAREKELIGELARMNRHRARGGHVEVQKSDRGIVPRSAPWDVMNPGGIEGTDAYYERAKGGQTSGGPYMVGERGPEMFVPDSPGTIIPNHEIQRLARKYGGHVTSYMRARGGRVR